MGVLLVESPLVIPFDFALYKLPFWKSAILLRFQKLPGLATLQEIRKRAREREQRIEQRQMRRPGRRRRRAGGIPPSLLP